MDVGGIKTEKWEYEEEYEEVDVDAVGNPMQSFNCPRVGACRSHLSLGKRL